MKKLIFLLIPIFIFGCENKEDNINKEFSKKGTVELMEEIEKDEYTLPRDGNLTEKQMEMYLAVKQEELVYAKQAAENLKAKSEKIEAKEKEGKKPGLGDYMNAFKAMGDVADFITADLRAAKKLGYNAKEYQWVKETIVKTRMAEWADNSRAATSKNYSEMLENLKKQREEATTKEMKDIYDQQITAISEGMKDMNADQHQDEGVTDHNKKLLAEYKDKISFIEEEVNKWRLLEKEKVHEN